ncbi:MAG: metallophosphoesterase [Bacteroidota bacterium]
MRHIPRIFRTILLLALPVLMHAGVISDDLRTAGDGPYVFYQGERVVVKYIVPRDSGLKVVTQRFPNRESVVLTCSVPETGDHFSFPLIASIALPPTRYERPERALVLSDIEGNFRALKTMLYGAGVIDRQLNWSYSNGSLILTGDFFDRGLRVTECLWLIYKLENEARAAGGSVHFLLGNHEVMNLSGESTYVRSKYVENARLMEQDYGDCFGVSSELGRWLRSKNAIEIIGDDAFCHGGISPEIMRTGLSPEQINLISRAHYGLQEREIHEPEARAVFNRKTGVFWYRGMAKAQLAPDTVTGILDYIGAKKIIIGHTLQKDVTASFGGRIICIDLFHEENMRQGLVKTLLIEQGKYYIIDSRGERHPIYVAGHN